MKKNTVIIVACAMVIALVSGGCLSVKKEQAAARRQIPFREASVAQGGKEFERVIVEADSISKKEQKKFFASKPSSCGELPVLLRVTNNSQDKILVSPLQIRLQEGGAEIPPSMLFDVYEDAQDAFRISEAFPMVLTSTVGFWIGRGEVKNAMQEEDELIANNYFDKAFHQTIIPPQQTAVGVVFFEKARGQNASLKVVIHNLNTHSSAITEVQVASLN